MSGNKSWRIQAMIPLNEASLSISRILIEFCLAAVAFSSQINLKSCKHWKSTEDAGGASLSWALECSHICCLLTSEATHLGQVCCPPGAFLEVGSALCLFSPKLQNSCLILCVFICSELLTWAVLWSPSGCVIFWLFLGHPLMLFFSSLWLVGEYRCEAVFNLERLWERDFFCSGIFLVLLHCCQQLLHREYHRWASCLLI